MKYYESFNANEKVYEDEWQDYVFDKLGLKIEPKGKYGELTQEQTQVILDTIDWYFSGNWVLRTEREDNDNEDYNAYMEDKIYMDNLDRRLMEEYDG